MIRLCTLIAALAATAWVAPAQEVRPRGSGGFEFRDKESLRPFDLEIELVGLEEKDNGFRQLTPVLDRSRKGTRYVDVEALHVRKQLQYEDGAAHHKALPRVVPGTPAAALDPSRIARAPVPPGLHHGESWPWVIAILGTMVVAVLLLIRSALASPLLLRRERFVIKKVRGGHGGLGRAPRG